MKAAIFCLIALPLSAQQRGGPANPAYQLDLQGKTTEARALFQTQIDSATDARAKAQAQRDMAMSFAFDGDCKNTAKYESLVIEYWKTRETAEPAAAFYQQGEMANEAARVCIDSGDLDTAERMYKLGHELGIKEPEGLNPGRRELWEFRTEHAYARLAARRGNPAEAQRYIALAKAALESIKAKSEALYTQQKAFLPYLTGYVALYSGDAKSALEDLQKANQNDAFIQCLIGMAYEKLGQKEQAMEAFRKASTVSSHNPPAAFARPFTRKKLAL